MGNKRRISRVFRFRKLERFAGYRRIESNRAFGKRDNLTSLILPDDVPVEEDQGEQDELFPLGYEDILEDC